MKKLLRIYLMFCLVLTIGLSKSYSQDDNDDVHNLIITLPEVALLDLEAAAGTTITLGPDAPTEAGEAINFSDESNADIWINYTSIIGKKTDPKRDITVQITSGVVPEGLLLNVLAAKDAGMGDGTMGTSTSTLVLDKKAQEIINGVGSAYTGDGVANGHQLTYTLVLDSKQGSYAKLDFDDANTLAITYTMTDQ